MTRPASDARLLTAAEITVVAGGATLPTSIASPVDFFAEPAFLRDRPGGELIEFIKKASRSLPYGG